MLNSLKRLINGDIPTTSVPMGGLELSIIVIVYDMPLQAKRTLQSLSPQYQEGVSQRDYEVIVVENQSTNNMDRDFLASLPGNFSYHLRAEREPTPVHAINHGVGISRGRHICIMIDGARMITPGVIKNILRGHRLQEKSVVTVPGYHIGERVQQDAVEEGYSVEEDQALIESVGWPLDGYRLFDIACFSSSCDPGFFLPNSESNCISVPRDIWAMLGGMDTRFNLRGGGLVNLDLYKRACEFTGAQHVMLMGEGTFHQFHGGVTTGGELPEVREQLMHSMNEQYEEIRGEPYRSPQSTPTYLGEMPSQVLRFVQHSVKTALPPEQSGKPVTLRQTRAASK